MSPAEAVSQYLQRIDLSRATRDLVADHFGVSPTTLRRRLAENGTSFLALKDAERLRRLAVADISARSDSLAEVTGHSDGNSLTRWYRGVTGQSWRQRWPNGRRLDLNFTQQSA